MDAPLTIDEELELIASLPLHERATALEALERRLRAYVDDEGTERE